MSFTDFVYTTSVEGVNKPVFFSEECFKSALSFKPCPGDIIIVTYPKCGTTWMQNLVLNILRKGEPLEKPKDFFLASPFLDQLGVEDSVKMMIRPGAYKTHLPLHKLHWSSDVKYIYVARNPKDCCISFYHHMKQLPGYQFDRSFDEFLKMFVAGEVEFGNYFDHLLPWLKLRHAPNVFFTTFEDMKGDLRKVTMELIEFFGKDESHYFSNNPDIVDKVLYNCSFEVMKPFYNAALSSLYDTSNKDLLTDMSLPKGRKHIIAYNMSLTKQQCKKIDFVRCGEVGKWKVELSTAQNDLLDEMIKKHTQDSDVKPLWKMLYCM